MGKPWEVMAKKKHNSQPLTCDCYAVRFRLMGTDVHHFPVLRAGSDFQEVIQQVQSKWPQEQDFGRFLAIVLRS